jgi:hypothetical protein
MSPLRKNKMAKFSAIIKLLWNSYDFWYEIYFLLRTIVIIGLTFIVTVIFWTVVALIRM